MVTGCHLTESCENSQFLSSVSVLSEAYDAIEKIESAAQSIFFISFGMSILGLSGILETIHKDNEKIKTHQKISDKLRKINICSDEYVI